ncbi:YybH family protein [Actinomadura fibrosa]|uniref:YybH family protein n=1 Tax=Actinomadura fibrosa TaxID=111802 RepID=A0ABW2XWS9_9ACTN|nr:DUF4440 domain-containing protein [Actinomadura fibrosa]
MPDNALTGPRSLAQLIALWCSACLRADVTELVSLYEDGALMVTSAGEVLEGRDRLGEALRDALACLPCAGRRETRRCLEGNGIALLINAWLGEEEQRAPDISTGGLGLMIARRQPDGRWLIAMDVPQGTV